MTVSGQTEGFDLSNYGVRIEPDKRLIVVLSTLEAATVKNGAGVDEKLINTPLTEKGVKFREQLLADNAELNEDLRRRISLFVTQYKKRNPALSDSDLIAPFISMAYTLSPVPELADPVVTSDLPGNLLDVLDFAPLVREFYRRSAISSKLDGYLRDYRADADSTLKSSAREMVSDLLNYLHTRPILIFTERIKVETLKNKSKSSSIQKVEKREHERRFFLVPEKLAARNNVNFLNIRDDYYVIVPPDTDLAFSEARRAFLQFVIDPLVLNNARETTGMREWAKPVLDDLRKADSRISPDLLLTISRSLVAAVDVRQAEYTQIRLATDKARSRINGLKTDAEKRAVSAELDKFKQSLSDESTLRLYEEYQKGAVLSLYFAEQLKGIEDSGFDIASSLREMIAAFDPAKETGRIAATADARTRAIAAREDRKKHPEAHVVIAENPVTTRLIEIQKLIDNKNYSQAGTDLKQLLASNPTEPRIHFNIGRVASLLAAAIEDQDLQAQRLVEAKTAYTEVLKNATSTTDKALLSLTYVALGRIYEYFNDNPYALKLYDEAIKLGEVKGGGHSEAIAAKQKLIRSR
jgi:hypothetical protein